ncbi:MAG: HigA family addiction module antitoxin [Bacteroidota bacterium]
MPMKNPAHPGEIVLHDCIEPLGLTITQAARGLGVARSTLSRLVNGKASVSPEMAVRLSKGFGSTPETWLRMQLNYDLAHMPDAVTRIKVERLEPA